MRARYFGKKIVRNEFGDVTARFDPEVEIVYTEAEAEAVEAWLSTTAYGYDLFGEGDGTSTAHVYVSDREDADDFLAERKATKKTFKKGA